MPLDVHTKLLYLHPKALDGDTKACDEDIS